MTLTCVDEASQTQAVLSGVQDSIGKVSVVVESLLQKVQSDQYDTAHGLGFLEVKNHTLISYLINLNTIICRKLRGQSLAGEPAIDHLIEDRIYLERMRPIEQKLRYQIDKYIRISTTGQRPVDDPLSFRARPEDLEDDDGEDVEDGSGDKSESKTKSEVYKPPKLAAVHYDGDESVESRRERRIAAAKRRALNTGVMHELGSEYLETPEEVHHNSDTFKYRASRRELERTEYEEDNMLRLPVTKKERHKRNQLTTDASLGVDFTRYTDLSALEGKDSGGGRGKKRKGSSGNKKQRSSLRKKSKKKARFGL